MQSQNQLQEVLLNYNIRVELASSLQNNEEEMKSILEEVTEHYADEGNVRKSLYKIRQKINTLTFAVMVKKSHYETLSKSDPASSDAVLKDISSNQIQLKQLLINEEVLVNRMKELNRSREALIKNIKQKQLLDDRWIEALSSHFLSEKELTLCIPTDNDLITKETQTIVETQDSIIAQLKEQLRMRDDMIETTRAKLKEQGATFEGNMSGVLQYEEIVKAADEERAHLAAKPILPVIQPSPFGQVLRFGENEKLFTRVSRFKLPKGIAKMTNDHQYVEATKVASTNHRDEKRSHSVISQNSSFSTGASSGPALANRLILNSLNAKQALHNEQQFALGIQDGKGIGNNGSNRKLINAGLEIATGAHRKFKIKRNSGHNPNIILRPEKSLFKHLSKNVTDI